MSDPKYATIGSPAMRLIEECGEVIQAVMKGERFGWGNHHPDLPPSITNLVALEKEVQDVICALWDLKNTQQASAPEPAKID